MSGGISSGGVSIIVVAMDVNGNPGWNDKYLDGIYRWILWRYNHLFV
jgi:hypothetical protein